MDGHEQYLRALEDRLRRLEEKLNRLEKVLEAIRQNGSMTQQQANQLFTGAGGGL